MFIYHFVDPDLGVEVFFEKKGGQLKQLCTLILEVEENFMQSLGGFLDDIEK